VARGRFLAFLAMLVAVVFWAAAFAAIRVGLRGYSPGALAFLRFAFASALLAVLAPVLRVPLPRARDWPGLALLALLGFVAYHLLLNYGERTTGAGSASLLVATAPLWTALFAAAGGGRLARRQIVGTVTGFTGAALISVGQSGSFRLDPGALMVVLAAVSEAGYFVLQRPFLLRYSAITLTVWTCVLATVFMSPFGAAAMSELPRAPLPATLAAVFLGAVPTVVSYVAWSYALRRIPAARTASALYALPVLAVTIAWVWLGEVPGITVLVGGGLALAGVAVVQIERGKGGTDEAQEGQFASEAARAPAPEPRRGRARDGRPASGRSDAPK
jgi:drug/metabolite transporter (DMT)-like permease